MRRLLLSLLAVGLIGMTIGCSGRGMRTGRCACFGDHGMRPAPWQLGAGCCHTAHHSPVGEPKAETKTAADH